MMLSICKKQALTFPTGDYRQTLTAASFVRRMRGGAQSSLLRASDGNLYVVKLMGNPQGENVLAHEALGSWLASCVGLDTPDWCPIAIDDAFIDDNPGMWFETPSGRQSPQAGIHYASRLLQAGERGAVYQDLPRNWFARVENREDFLGMLLLDLWSGHADNRQACFVRQPCQRSLRAVFLDHGHMFGGPGPGTEWNIRPACAMFLDRTMYDGLWSESQVSEWIRRIYSIRVESAYIFAASLPEEWSATPMEEVVSVLIERRQMLMDLVEGLRPYLSSAWPGRKSVRSACPGFELSCKPLLAGHGMRQVVLADLPMAC